MRYDFNEVTTIGTMEQALAVATEHDKRKFDVRVYPTMLEFDHSDGRMLVHLTHGEFKGASWHVEPAAWGSLLTKMTPLTEYEKAMRFRRNRKAIADLLYGIPAGADFANSMRGNLKGEFRFRLYDTTGLTDSDPNAPVAVRAIVSDKYLPIDNLTVLGAAAEQLGVYPLSKNSYIGRDGFGIQSILDQYQSGAYGVGSYLTNAELGNSSVGMRPLVQRNSCTNSMIIASVGMGNRWVHRVIQQYWSHFKTD
jgi:hypothetical protein